MYLLLPLKQILALNEVLVIVRNVQIQVFLSVVFLF